MKGLSGRLPILIFLGRREIEKAPLRITGAGEETGRDRRLGREGGGEIARGTDSERHREELCLLSHPAVAHTGFYLCLFR